MRSQRDTPIQVSKSAVRRFLLAEQRLTPQTRQTGKRMVDALALVRHLECVQLDPVAAVERNQHLVMAARMPGYRPRLMDRLLAEGDVFEYWANAACVIPMTDYPLFEIRRRALQAQLQPELDKLGDVVNAVLHRLEQDGPLPSKAFQSDDKVHGYWDNVTAKTKATSHALNLLHDTGRIQVVRRDGVARHFDLRERAVPAHLLTAAQEIGHAEASDALIRKYIRAYRIFDVQDSRFGWQRLTAAERKRWVEREVAAGKVVPLQIAEVSRQYYALAEDAGVLEVLMREERDRDGIAGRNASARTGNRHLVDRDLAPVRSGGRALFLPPLDNLLWRRSRIEDLFGFSYTWEIYTPAAKRRYGYYTMPILVGDAIVGRIDPRLNRDTQTLDIQMLQLDAGRRWTKTLQSQVYRGLEAFAKFHGAVLGKVAEITLGDEPHG